MPEHPLEPVGSRVDLSRHQVIEHAPPDRERFLPHLPDQPGRAVRLAMLDERSCQQPERDRMLRRRAMRSFEGGKRLLEAAGCEIRLPEGQVRREVVLVEVNAFSPSSIARSWFPAQAR